MFRNLSFFTALLTIVLATFVQAQEEHGHFDVFVAAPDGGTGTVYGGIDVDDGDIELGLQVFEVELGKNTLSNVFNSDEPGFNHPADDTALPAGSATLIQGDEILVRGLDLTIGGVTAPLFYWDGSGAVSFAPAVGTTFDIITPVPGNPSIGAAGADGGFDDHPIFELSSGGTLPATGIYLGAMEVEAEGYDPSDPLYLVMGTECLITPEFLGISQGDFDMLTDEELDEELEEVIEMGAGYVEANVVPEPNGLLLAAMGLFAMMMIRRTGNRR